MEAYHNDLKIKDKFVARMKAHIKPDEFNKKPKFEFLQNKEFI